MLICPYAPCMVYIYTNVWLKFMVNVDTYSIHGAFGMCGLKFLVNDLSISYFKKVNDVQEFW